jgi:hypothetical protein
MIILKATTESLQLITTTTANIDYSISYVDITTTTFTPSTNEGTIATATTTSVLSAPASSTQRQVKLITFSNRHATSSNTLTLQKLISSTTYNITPTVTLAAGETMQYMDGNGWINYSATGSIKGSQTAAGSNMQVQYNSGGALAGDPNLLWDTVNNILTIEGNNAQLQMGVVSATPAVPPSGTLAVYSQLVSGKTTLMKQSHSGDAEALQAAFWQNNIVMWTPGGASNAGNYLGTAGTNLGTPALGTQATTNIYTTMRRSVFPTVTTANTQVGARTEAMFFRGAATGMGGFLFVCRFGLEVWTTGNRLFVGLSAASTALTTVNPSTVANSIGFAVDASDTTISFLHVDGTPTATKETISSQPALATNNGYDAYIYCRPNDTTVYFRLDNVNTGVTLIDSSVTTTLPVNTTMLVAHAAMGNAANTGSAAAKIGVNRMYIETNR